MCGSVHMYTCARMHVCMYILVHQITYNIIHYIHVYCAKFLGKPKLGIAPKQTGWTVVGRLAISVVNIWIGMLRNFGG